MYSIGTYSDISDSYDEIWYVMRSFKGNCDSKHIHKPNLSPSDWLFGESLRLREEGKWCQELFDNWFTPLFLKELRGNKKELDMLKCNSKNILLVCACKNECMCHRKLLKLALEEKVFRLLVVGSRGFNDIGMTYKYLDSMLTNVNKEYEIEIVSGGAKGADSLAIQYAVDRGYRYKIFRPAWTDESSASYNKNLGYDKRAGYIRNRIMREYISEVVNVGCVAFWDGVSKGTQENFEALRELNIPLRICKF